MASFDFVCFGVKHHQWWFYSYEYTTSHMPLHHHGPDRFVFLDVILCHIRVFMFMAYIRAMLECWLNGIGSRMTRIIIVSWMHDSLMMLLLLFDGHSQWTCSDIENILASCTDTRIVILIYIIHILDFLSFNKTTKTHAKSVNLIEFAKWTHCTQKSTAYKCVRIFYSYIYIWALWILKSNSSITL